MFAFLRRLAGVELREFNQRVDGLLSAPEFAVALAKERARTDRGGAGFSMLALAIGAPVDSPAFQESAWILASLLLERTRLIDTKGWFGVRVAVIFPQTPADRIQHIWTPIKEAFDTRLNSTGLEHLQRPDIRCEVFAYPCENTLSALPESD